MQIYTNNFVQLLRWAISEREKFERKNGYTSDSGMVATWKNQLKMIENGERTIWLQGDLD
jgi:hypothetical protein